MLTVNLKYYDYNARKWATAFLILFITVVIYLPALENEFVTWDDDMYIYQNQDIRSIDLLFFKWMFTTDRAFNWHPLTWLSHAVDYALWGLNPAGHHFTNILLHGLNSLLFFFLVMALVERAKEKKQISVHTVIVGSVAGLLFGLHPIHVESVAWASERKDVLCAFFFLLSLIAYVRYTAGSVQKRRYLNYSLCLLFFFLALISKPMAVTLPVVLIILDVYPLERFNAKSGFQSLRKIITEKIPFIMLSALSSVLTLYMQQVLVKEHPLLTRLLVSIESVPFYIFKTLLPVDLAPLYPYPEDVSLWRLKTLGSLVLILGITLLCVVLWKKQKYFFSMWAYYLVTLLPVLGIVQVGKQAAADRYMYLPGLPLFILAGILVGWIWKRAGVRRQISILLRLLTASGIIIIVCILSVLTVNQISTWENTIALLSHEIEKYPDFPDAYALRGITHIELGDYYRAIEDLNKAILLKPKYASAFKFRGRANKKLERYQEALQDYSTAINIAPTEFSAYFERGELYVEIGDYKRAVHDYSRAIDLNYLSWKNVNARGINPDQQYALAYLKRGETYEKLGNYEKALQDFNKVISLYPDKAEVHNRRGMVNGILGNYQQAIQDFTRTIKLNPQHMQAYNNRAGLHALTGNYKNAIEDLDIAIELNPESVDSYVNRGMLYLQMGKETQAVRDFQIAARMNDKQAREYLDSKGIGW